ncbi:ketosynthase chain-length factor [Streptomyces sp. ISL-10]|uniref:ketosynthase chain-length factor n=1 Tax=Streptomyces sp. ISL-10 TaxID=2819172 RepID=UPI001BE582D1|nr:ketosynthase chain-length factor [Streptomyces sp. ISL-10]MBT2368636.1 ketosynthase chain-length factor [Streptomyces sp. ISL-10]
MTTTVVTGLGVVSPNGLGTDEFWTATLKGHSGIGEISRFDTTGCVARLAGEVDEFDPAQHLSNRLLPQTDRSTRFALVAADWALADAGADSTELADYDMGVVTSSAFGGFEFTHREFAKLWSRGPKHVSVYESFAWFYAVNTGQISIKHKLRGPSKALVAEQAGGLDALGHARRAIRDGARLMVAGGMDSALDPWGWASQLSSGRVSPDGYLPFDRSANGHVPGEGGALLVLEEAPSARRRGVTQVYGEIAGYAATFDPPPGSPRPPALRRAIELALADAGMSPGDVDVVFADGAGIPELDRQEAAALRDVFGERAVPVTVPKALTGRLMSGGGPLDVVAALLSLRDGVIPPTATTHDVPDDYGTDLVLGAPRYTPLSAAMVLARGKWGFNSAVVVRAADF